MTKKQKVKTFSPRAYELMRGVPLWLAHRDFWSFRISLRPHMIVEGNWWQQDVARHLMWFYDALCEGKRPKLILMAPPQHGKALSLDTPIPTPTGWTTLGQLQVGDTLFDETGKPSCGSRCDCSTG